MELRTIVYVNGGEACYSVESEGRGMFQAVLLNYKGNPNAEPPNCITLVRGLRKWTGSSDDERVLQFLGDVIDTAIKEAPIFYDTSNDSRTPSQGRGRDEAAFD